MPLLPTPFYIPHPGQQLQASWTNSCFWLFYSEVATKTSNLVAHSFDLHTNLKKDVMIQSIVSLGETETQWHWMASKDSRGSYHCLTPHESCWGQGPNDKPLHLTRGQLPTLQCIPQRKRWCCLRGIFWGDRKVNFDSGIKLIELNVLDRCSLLNKLYFD